MKNKRKILMVILIIIIIIAIIAIVNKNKTKSEGETTVTPYEYASDIETVKELEAEINESIITALAEVEEDYQAGVKNYSGYKRSDFYTETRINREMSSGEISFVEVEDISTDELYNLNGEKIEEVPEITFNGVKVDLETDNNITVEKYYLLRCESGQMYNYYYVMTINVQGTAEIEWLCYTENEITDSELLEEMETEENLLIE